MLSPRQMYPPNVTMADQPPVLYRVIDRELSALSQAVGRLRKRMADNKLLQEKVKKIFDAIKTPKCQA